MELIDLSKFLSLINCENVNDCWFNKFCKIDKNGIKAKPSNDKSINRHTKSQHIKLDFPCAPQQFLYWAQNLDSYLDKKKQSLIFDRLPKEFKLRLQQSSEFFRNVNWIQAVIKEKIGTSPFDTDWKHWLTVPKWTKKEAALLIAGFEPVKFHEVERLDDYKSLCEPLDKLIRRIPDELSATSDWLIWFDENGYLYFAPKPLRDWYEEQHRQIKNMALNDHLQDDGSSIQDSTELESTSLPINDDSEEKTTDLIDSTPVATEPASSTLPVSDNPDEELAALFDPVPVEVLAKMFQADRDSSISLKKWKGWQNKAKENRLIEARQMRGMYNPYKAGMWFVHKGIEGWDDARLNRKLAKNLPPRSRDYKHMLIDDVD
jgi:hypothetical protein